MTAGLAASGSAEKWNRKDKMTKANSVLLQQFLKGITFDQMLLVDLHLRDCLQQSTCTAKVVAIGRSHEVAM